MEAELIYVGDATEKDPRKILERINLGGIEKIIARPSLVDYSPRKLKDIAKYLRGLSLSISDYTGGNFIMGLRQVSLGHISYTHAPSALGSSWVTGTFYEANDPKILVVSNELVFEEALVNQVLSVISGVNSEEKEKLRLKLRQYQKAE